MPFLAAPALRLPPARPCRPTPRQHVVCGRRPNRHKRGPTPVSTRAPSPSLPSVSIPVRHTQIANPIPKAPGVSHLRKLLQSRRDVLLSHSSPHAPGAVAAALSAREQSESVLIVVPTREDVLIASHEARATRRGAPVIVAAGGTNGTMRNAAMIANSTRKAVIVVASIRAVHSEFTLNGHGRPWLTKVNFCIFVHPSQSLRVAGLSCFNVVLRALPPVSKRKNVVVCVAHTHGHAPLGIHPDKLLRDKHDVVEWNDHAPKLTLQTNTSSIPTHLNTHNNLQPPYPEAHSPTSTSTPVQHLSSIPSSTPPQPLPALRNVVLHVGSSSGLYAELKRQVAHILSTPGARMAVFFPTARLVELYATMARADGLSVVELHGRSSTAKRDATLDWLAGASGVVFASDVLACGVIMQPLTLVVQVGLPARATFAARAALAATDGRVVVLAMRREVEAVRALLTEEGCMTETTETHDVPDGMVWNGEGVDARAKSKAYLSAVTYYTFAKNRFGGAKRTVVDMVNLWAVELLGDVPGGEKRIVKKMSVGTKHGLAVKPTEVVPPNKHRRKKQRSGVKKNAAGAKLDTEH